MLIKVKGDNETARALRANLNQAGFAVSASLPDNPTIVATLNGYVVEIVEGSGSEIIVDSIDCPLERAIFKHVTELSKNPVVVNRPGGFVHSEREISITVPPTIGQRRAVSLGVLRGFLDLAGPKPNTLVRPKKKNWFARIFTLFALVAILSSSSLAAPRSHSHTYRFLTESGEGALTIPEAPGLFPQLRIATARFDGSGNLLINCITGCSATSGFVDNSAYTVGTSTINVIGAYFTSGADPACTTGNACRLRADASSNLKVNCVVGCSASAGFADNAAFTAGTTPVSIAGGWFSNSPTACTTGSACAPSLTSDRKLFVQSFQGTSPWVVSASGNFGVTQQTSPWVDNITQWNSVALGSPSAYGTSPGAVNVPGVNAFITNTPTVTANAGTNLNTSALALDTSVNGILNSQGSTTSGQKGPLDQCAVTTGAPTYTTAQTDPLSCTIAGGLRVDGSGVTQPVSGTVTANQGTANSAANGWPAKVTDGTNTAAVKAASTAAIATDPSLVVALSPNSPIPTGSNTIGALTANQSVNVAQVAGTNTVTDGAAGVLGVGGHKADNGVAAGTDRLPTMEGIYRTDYHGGSAGTAGNNAAPDVGTDGLLHVAALPAIRPASFHASGQVASAATATDIATMPGNASNTVLVTKIQVTCNQTTAGTVTLSVLKRSAADTAGTSAAMTVVPDDSNYSAGVSAPKVWTANPTKGTLVGTLDTYKLGCMAPATATPNDLYVLNLRQKPIVLRGTAQEIEINLGAPVDGTGTTVTGGSFDITFEWMEVTTITP